MFTKNLCLFYYTVYYMYLKFQKTKTTKNVKKSKLKTYFIKLYFHKNLYFYIVIGTILPAEFLGFELNVIEGIFGSSYLTKPKKIPI